MKKFFIILIASSFLEAQNNKITPKKVNNYVKTLCADTYHIGEELFTLRSMKIISGFLPFFITSLHFDNKIHSHFYDNQNHLNINHPSARLNRFIHPLVVKLPLITCAILSLTSKDEFQQRGMRMFVIGAVLKIFTKELIKSLCGVLKPGIARRPLSGFFDENVKVYNAFPSGHAAFAAFSATYLGLYKGPIVGIPLGMYALFIMGMRTAQNAHFSSQVVAGAGFGVLFGASSFAVFQKTKLPENISLGVVSDGPSRLGLSLTYDF